MGADSSLALGPQFSSYGRNSAAEQSLLRIRGWPLNASRPEGEFKFKPNGNKWRYCGHNQIVFEACNRWRSGVAIAR